MPNLLKITAENTEELLNTGAYGAGAVIRLQSCATIGGAYADVSGTGSTPTIAIVSGTEVYSGYDPTGTAVTYYKTRYENAGATRVSDWSAPFQAGDASTAYASLATFRSFIRNQATGALDVDSDLEILALEAAARAIDHECGRTFRLATGTPTARLFTAGISTGPTGGLGTRYAVDVDDFFSIAAMTVTFDASGDGDYTTATTGYRALPVYSGAMRMPFRSLVFDRGVVPPLWQDGVSVLADWGWDTYPPNVVTANLIQASRFLKRRDSPYGVAGSPEMGNELRLLSKLDPDVEMLLRPFKLVWGFA